MDKSLSASQISMRRSTLASNFMGIDIYSNPQIGHDQMTDLYGLSNPRPGGIICHRAGIDMHIKAREAEWLARQQNHIADELRYGLGVLDVDVKGTFKEKTFREELQDEINEWLKDAI